MGHGGYTLELSLRDSVSAGLKDMGRALSNVRELVGSLRADVSALNKASGPRLCVCCLQRRSSSPRIYRYTELQSLPSCRPRLRAYCVPKNLKPHKLPPLRKQAQLPNKLF